MRSPDLMYSGGNAMLAATFYISATLATLTVAGLIGDVIAYFYF